MRQLILVARERWAPRSIWDEGKDREARVHVEIKGLRKDVVYQGFGRT